MTKPAKLNASNLWTVLRHEAETSVKKEPDMTAFMKRRILDHANFAEALCHVLADKLEDTNGIPFDVLFALFLKCCKENAEIISAAKKDLLAVMERDPAASDVRTAFLYFKGYHAIQAHRMTHHLWNNKRQDMARYLQSQSSLCFGVDIHPAAVLGRGLMMDHATGVVIGETAIVGNDVSMLHAVTLGGTGKETGDRHPKIGDGVLLGAGAKILGNIEIGHCTRVAAGSVVLSDVPANVTVAGIPARVVGKAGCAKPGTVMDQVPKFLEKLSGTSAKNYDWDAVLLHRLFSMLSEIHEVKCNRLLSRLYMFAMQGWLQNQPRVGATNHCSHCSCGTVIAIRENCHRLGPQHKVCLMASAIVAIA